MEKLSDPAARLVSSSILFLAFVGFFWLLDGNIPHAWIMRIFFQIVMIFHVLYGVYLWISGKWKA